MNNQIKKKLEIQIFVVYLYELLFLGYGMMVWLTQRTHEQYLDSVSAHPSTPPNNTHISECSGCSEQPYYNLQSPPQLNIMMFINIHYLFINIQTLWIFMTYIWICMTCTWILIRVNVIYHSCYELVRISMN